MKNQLSTFNFKTHPVRIEKIDNELYFCLSDVCLALNISNATSSRFRLNEKGLHKMYTLTNGGKQELAFINEPNLYRIIFRSNKAEAVDFQNWVFEEVLPQIRETGSYIQETTQMLPPERIINTEIPESDALRLASLWFALYKCRETLSTISEPLTALGSKLGSMAYTQATEYYNVLETTKQIIEPILDGIQSDDRHYRLALDTLRNHQIRRISRLAIR